MAKQRANDDQFDIFGAGPIEAFIEEARRPAVDLGSDWIRLGSIFAGEDGLQVIGEHGAEPATVPLRHTTRVEMLCSLRDAARGILRAELANAPDYQQDDLRADLNRIYDEFVHTFGPINAEAAGNVRIKSPNLHGFEGDPDAPILRALEIVDIEKGTFDKAAIFSQPVVRHIEPITSVKDPSDALMLCLDRFGAVRMDFIASLLGCSESEATDSLFGEVYQNPTTGRFETASEYLSGNVRVKLADAEAAAKADPQWQAHVVALRAVQPDDLTEREILPSLGATWIPASDVADFVAHLLEISPRFVDVTYYEPMARWTVTVGRQFRSGMRATRTWGTHRMDAVDLVRGGLNQREPLVRDRIPHADPPAYRKNETETLAAREKLTAIRDEFTRWLWSDNARTVRLVTEYNRLFNSWVERAFDGSHLTLPGAASNVVLRAHQKNAIWRGLQTGNLLAAHEVGTGKTWIEAGLAMESKRLGLASKPCLTVPNHMIEQVTRDFLQMYPTARLIVGGRDEAQKGRRDDFFARVAMSDCDAVIMTHNTFEQLQVSFGFEERLIREQIERFSHPQPGEDHNERRAREGACKEWQRRLDRSETRAERQATVCFEETGIDLVIVDEADIYKGLPIYSKNRALASEGSQRAHQMLLRARYIDSLTPGHGLVFASGTPISNSLAEVYVMQTFLQHRRLEELGVAHFDAWAANFGETVTAFEIAPGGGFRIATRFARFKNVPELIGLLREVMDVALTADLDLPVPQVRGGGPNNVVVEPTDAQAAYFQELIDRTERLRTTKVDPSEDNILVVINDAAKASLDLRLVDPEAQDNPQSKISVAAERIAALWHDTKAERLTQLVFCDLSTPRPHGFHVYGALKEKLVAEGVSAGDIAFIHDAASDRAKARLFSAMNAGQIRVLVASTEKAGLGTNVQRLLKRISHLDAPWRPRDMLQRDGRGVRQGNLNDEIEIDRYVTERSFDAYRYQALERKAAFIGQIMKGEISLRTIEDVDDVTLSFATMKAIATGNPLIREKAETEVEIARLQRIVRQERSQRWHSKQELGRVPDRRAAYETQIEKIRADLQVRVPTAGEAFRFISRDGGVVTERADAGRLFAQAFELAKRHAIQYGSSTQRIGTLGGFDLYAEKVRGLDTRLLVQGKAQYTRTYEVLPGDHGMVISAERLIDGIDQTLASTEAALAGLTREAKRLEEYLRTPSALEDQLDALESRLFEIDTDLGITPEALAAAQNEEAGEDDEHQPNEPSERPVAGRRRGPALRPRPAVAEDVPVPPALAAARREMARRMLRNAGLGAA